jgi:uncharacterized protein
MSRLILLVVLIAAIYLLLKFYRRGVTKNDEPAQVEAMVRCEQCGVHLPKSESVQADGNYFCSDAHNRIFQNRKD